MNADILKGKWKQFKGSVKTQWGKLTDNDLDVIDGNVDRLVGKLQVLYGETRDAIRAKVDAFMATLHEGAESARDVARDTAEQAADAVRKAGDKAKTVAKKVADRVDPTA